MEVKAMKKRNGFTLIELLVVVAIIAVLISMLLPALSRARGSAKQVVCLSNMKSYGTALYIYLGENNSIFPYFFYDESYDWSTCWFNTLGPLAGLEKRTDDRNNVAKGRQCVADVDTWIGVNYGVRVEQNTPLTYRGPFVYRFMNGKTYPNVTLSGIDNPSEYLAFADVRSNYYFYSPWQWGLNYDSDKDGRFDSNINIAASWEGLYNGAAAKIHNNGMNAIFCDGSGRWFSYKKDWQDPSMKYFRDE
jgi:prepilin-type N-terminal cleavage/methylation domain-containing protein/prepilin-type processing-associated H-X9-DG protein